MKYLPITPVHLDKFARDYRVEHSKFIHPSWLLLEDLGKVSTINGISWTIMGLWDVHGIRREILIKSEKGAFAVADSRVVSEGLGFKNMRNLVTGKEHSTFKFYSTSELNDLKKVDLSVPDDDSDLEETEVEEKKTDTDEDFPGVWQRIDSQDDTSDEDDNEEEEIDPLIKALRDDISDE